MKNPMGHSSLKTLAEDIGQARKRASDDADSIFNQVERKLAVSPAPPVQAACSDDDLMSTPRKPEKPKES